MSFLRLPILKNARCPVTVRFYSTRPIGKRPLKEDPLTDAKPKPKEFTPLPTVRVCLTRHPGEPYPQPIWLHQLPYTYHLCSYTVKHAKKAACSYWTLCHLDLAMAEAALRSSISDFNQKRRSSNHDSQWQSTIQAQAPAQVPPSSTTVLSTNQQPQQRHLGISPQDPVIQAPMRLPPSGSHLLTSRSQSAHQPQPLAGVPEETISQQMRGLSVCDNSARPMCSISGSSTAVPLGGQPALPSQVYHAPPMMQQGPPPFVPQPSNQGQRYHTAPSGHATYQPEQQYIPQSLPPPPVRNPPESRQWPTPQQTRPQEPGSGHHRGLSDLSAFNAPVPGSSRSSQYSNTGSYNSGNDQYGGRRPSTSASGSSWDEYNRAAASRRSSSLCCAPNPAVGASRLHGKVGVTHLFRLMSSNIRYVCMLFRVTV
ncbi:hypothetical protein NMY22_g8660 [Coprinellus aureogranulatus]|nr:hypothetical protein NMY22_g8660 [Coprinellus aureogranulatus]